MPERRHTTVSTHTQTSYLIERLDCVYLEASLGSIALDILLVDDDLNDSIPHLFTHVVTGQSD